MGNTISHLFQGSRLCVLKTNLEGKKRPLGTGIIIPVVGILLAQRCYV